MDNNTEIYRARKTAMLWGLIALTILFFGLTLPVLIAGVPLPQEQLAGLIGFWIIGIVVTAAPLGLKVEIQGDTIRAYYFNLLLKELRPSDVQSITYENLFWFGSWFGKGLIIFAKIKGKTLRLTMGESLYGKEAIAHVRRVLER